MSVLLHEVRRGAYADSIVLMQLQTALAKLPGVADAAVVMATATNLELLTDGGLLPASLPNVGPDDLLIVVRGESDDAARAALTAVDGLMERRAAAASAEFRPHSLDSALRLEPDARWVAISVPGRYAAGVARQAVELNRNVFLYSDNVPLDEEVALKRLATAAGALVMGPDCGTAIVGGVGLGFANRVAQGPVGVVGASGTGIQAVASKLAAKGIGLSHALGTGGRDLGSEVSGSTSHRALDLLARDAATEVIVLLSKPPSPDVTGPLLVRAAETGKPVVVYFLGQAPPLRRLGALSFAADLDEVSELVENALAGRDLRPPAERKEGFVRGLFAGGTLALEACRALSVFWGPLAANFGGIGWRHLDSVTALSGHVVLDLGADEFTVGRPHPMIDQTLRLERLRDAAADPQVAVVLLDIVLGDGAHMDPAAELAPAIAAAKQGRELEVIIIVIGTERDPQDLESQVEKLETAGARTVRSVGEAVELVSCRLEMPPVDALPPVALEALAPRAVINVGLESFADSLAAQGVAALHVDWRPPAGGDKRMLAILEKMRG